MKTFKVFLLVLVMLILSTSLVYAVDMGGILPAETRSGSISAPSQTDSFTFNGEAGQTVLISMSRQSGILNPQIYLYDPDGIVENGNNCGDDRYGCFATTIGDYQLLQSGLYTIVVRDYAGNDTGNYSLSYTKTPGTQYTPSVRINLNQNSFNTGDELIVSAHVTNGPDPAHTEVKLWITLPDGNNMSIFNTHFAFIVGPDSDLTREIFRYTFNGSEPSGDYNAGGRLIDPMTGRELSVNVESFSFAP